MTFFLFFHFDTVCVVPYEVLFIHSRTRKVHLVGKGCLVISSELLKIWHHLVQWSTCLKKFHSLFIHSWYGVCLNHSFHNFYVACFAFQQECLALEMHNMLYLLVCTTEQKEVLTGSCIYHFL